MAEHRSKLDWNCCLKHDYVKYKFIDIQLGSYFKLFCYNRCIVSQGKI